MIRSMTAFGNAQASLPRGSVAVEIRSVNSRFLDLHFRLPDEFRHLESQLRERLTRALQRGKVELRVTANWHPVESAQLNFQVIDELAQLFRAVRGVIPDVQPPRLVDVLGWPGVQSEAIDQDAADQAVLAAADSALHQLQQARAAEGSRLAEAMRNHAADMRAIVDALEAQMPTIVADYQTRLARKLRETIEAAFPGGFQHITGAELSERIANEAALFSLRIDVAEELSRLKSHLVELEHILGRGSRPDHGKSSAPAPAPKGAGSVGKRLDFLFQEMNREANTLGSKAGALEMTRAAVGLKLLIEQLREQAQNIE